MSKTAIIIIAAFIGLIGALTAYVSFTKEDMPLKSAVTVHKTVTCGCCANYVGYLKTNGYQVKVVNHTDDKLLTKEKRSHGIPGELDSCHTTLFDKENYFVEGHIPLEAIDKLLTEAPDIAGIGMPGMPSASPGMPGSKTEPFNISQVGIDGNVTDYLTL